MGQGVILLADNLAEARNSRQALLERAGYTVLMAANPQEARDILTHTHVDLAILDLRLEDDHDEKDVSGLTLAQHTAPSVPKILLTQFPSIDSVRIALSPTATGGPAALAYVAKEEGPEALLQAVEQAFAQHVRSNRDLVLQTSPSASITWPHLVSLIVPDCDTVHLSSRAEELEDLFRRLFFTQSQITLARLLWQRPGRVALVVLAFQEGAPPESFVVVCGQQQEMADTAQRYKTSAPKIPGETGTVLSLSVETIHFAAQAYSVAGVDLEHVASLAELYRTASDKVCHTALERLVQQTLAAWHQEQRLRDDTQTLDALYRTRLPWGQRDMSPSAWTARVQALVHQLPTLGVRLTYAEQHLTLAAYGQTWRYPDPLPLLERPSAIGQPVMLVNTPGTLAGETILADTHGRTWLTDFAQAGLAPVLWNVVTLEALIRFDWVESSDLRLRHELEQCLVQSPFLHLDSRDLEPSLRKPVRVIQTLRRLAAPLVEDDPASYALGLFFQAMDRLSYLNPTVQLSKSELVRLGHVLLSAAMLAGQLGPATPVVLTANAAERAQGIIIDQANHAVWINGARVLLVGQSYHLLCYLHSHSPQLCTRREIVEHALGQAYDDTDTSQVRRLNTAIRRLREKIEDDPGQPRYLLTEPGGGYRLLCQ